MSDKVYVIERKYKLRQSDIELTCSRCSFDHIDCDKLLIEGVEALRLCGEDGYFVDITEDER